MWDKMDEEKKAKFSAKIKEMGIDEKIIDEHLIWKFKKLSHKLMRLRLMLDEKGVSDAKIKEILDKLVDKAMKKDLAKMKQWVEEHKDNDKECHCDHKGKDCHCKQD